MFCSLVTIITNGFHPRKFIHENFSMKQISNDPRNFISLKIIRPTVFVGLVSVGLLDKRHTKTWAISGGKMVGTNNILGAKVSPDGVPLPGTKDQR